MSTGFREVKQELAERDGRLGGLALELIDQRVQTRMAFQSLDDERRTDPRGLALAREMPEKLRRRPPAGVGRRTRRSSSPAGRMIERATPTWAQVGRSHGCGDRDQRSGCSFAARAEGRATRGEDREVAAVVASGRRNETDAGVQVAVVAVLDEPADPRASGLDGGEAGCRISLIQGAASALASASASNIVSDQHRAGAHVGA